MSTLQRPWTHIRAWREVSKAIYRVATWSLSPITHYTSSNLLKGMGTVEVLPRTRKLKKTAKPTRSPTAKPTRSPNTSSPSSSPTTSKPTSSPTSSPSSSPTSPPTAPKTVDELVSTLPFPHLATDAKWYLFDMLQSATAVIVTLENEVNDGKNGALVNGAPGSPAAESALRLQTTIYEIDDQAEVGIKFHDGLFGGMKFKDMVTNGISFEYSFFLAFVPLIGGDPANSNEWAAPAIKMAVYSPSTGKSTTFMWEPYVGDLPMAIPLKDKWVTNTVDPTTGSSTPLPGSGEGAGGWSQTNWQPLTGFRYEEWGGPNFWLAYTRSLETWRDYFITDDYPDHPMRDAIITSVSISLGTYNEGVTSYVDSLRIKVGDYDWKWTFGKEIFE